MKIVNLKNITPERLFKNKDVLPPSGMYKEFLMIQANREGITLEQCRDLHGLKTIREWEQLLNF